MATKSSNVAVMGGVAGCLALAAIAYNTMRQTNPAPKATPSINPEAHVDGASSYKLIDGNATSKESFAHGGSNGLLFHGRPDHTNEKIYLKGFMSCESSDDRSVAV
jgi:hypothetical protein